MSTSIRKTGIIQDPLTDHAKLVAATRPIPMGLGNDLVLSSDDKFLTVSYPGVGLAANTVSSNGVGATFTFDVQQMITTLENPGNYLLDSFNRGIDSFAFNLTTERQATSNDLSYVPIDDINPQIDRVAADFQIIQGDWRYNQFTFGVPDTSIYAPVGRGANPGGLTSASVHQFVNLEKVENTASLTPTFKWNFDGQKDDDGDVCSLPVDPNEVQSVDLYISVFDKGQGLLPNVTWPDLQPSNPSLNDYNPNRILTAHWTKESEWTWNGKQDDGEGNSPLSFKLPQELKLTAGQTYYWAVKARRDSGEESPPIEGKFQTPLAKTNNGTFSGVTILTRGTEKNGSDIDNEFEAMARHIALLDVNDPNLVSPDDQGMILKYDTGTSKWKNILTNTLINSRDDLDSYLGKSLVLLPGWEMLPEETKNNSGFSEAAADAFYASLVWLDLTLGGSIGINNRIYDDTGKLIRNQGELFNSSLHFIGFGQGAVVNDEIIQRLGTDYPIAGGFNKDDRDLQMTTIDPYDRRQASLNIDFTSLYEPEIKVWNNITFADNYYQEFQVSGKTDTRLGERITDADLNVDLSKFAGFGTDDGQGSLHDHALAWYAGTLNLTGSSIPSLGDEKVYRRLGDLEPADRDNNISISKTWYTPDYAGYQYDRDYTNAPWEGIGTGWFHSVLGGGYKSRPYTVNGQEYSRDNIPYNFEEYLEDRRYKVSEDNTPISAIRGDYAVPTLFNGNFDAIFYPNTNQYIPGWYSGSKTNNQLKQSVLEDVSTISGAIPNYALQLNANTTTAIHDWFVVPESGVLRFNLNVPQVPQGGKLKVSMKGIDDNQWQPLTTLWGYRSGSYNADVTTERLEGVELSAGDYSYQFTGSPGNYQLVQNPDRSRSNLLGYATQGFETFTFDGEVLERLRGKPALLQFQLEGNTEVLIDDVFFQSQHLYLGNPTEARYSQTNPDSTNLIIERPQYALSYNSETKTPNWVSWQLNSDSYKEQNGVARPILVRDGIEKPEDMEQNEYTEFGYLYPFEADYALPDTWSAKANSYLGENIYDRGHLSASDDRNRDRKDQLATYLMSNILPIHKISNRDGAWRGLEKHEQRLVKNNNNLYTIAGGYGTKKLADGTPLKINGEVTVPERLWKVVLVLKPGQTIYDINENTRANASYLLIKTKEDFKMT